jgi:hypothetical protein
MDLLTDNTHEISVYSNYRQHVNSVYCCTSTMIRFFVTSTKCCKVSFQTQVAIQQTLYEQTHCSRVLLAKPASRSDNQAVIYFLRKPQDSKPSYLVGPVVRRPNSVHKPSYTISFSSILIFSSHTDILSGLFILSSPSNILFAFLPC